MANPFDDDMDMPKSYSKKSNNTVNPDESDFNFYERQIEQILQSSLESSNKSVLLLEESEAVGTATAQDLLTQGEKLRKVDNQLDEINATTKQTQKHLNNIKSIFGGVKNYFSKSTPATKDGAAASAKPAEPPRKLESTINKFGSNDVPEMSGSKSSSSLKQSSSTSHSLSDSSRAAIAGTRWGAMDEQIDENLDSMSANLRRLRELGSALGSEIDDQNKLLDKIAVKADKTDVEIRHQDKQMKRILGADKKKAPPPDDEKEKSGKK